MTLYRDSLDPTYMVDVAARDGKFHTVEEWQGHVVSEEIYKLKHKPGMVTIYDKEGKVVEVIDPRHRRTAARRG